MDHRAEGASARWAWVLVLVTAAISATQAVLMVHTGVRLLSEDAFRNAFPLVNIATVVAVLVGAVILSRHPHHRIGWLFCWGQLGVAAGLLMRTIADGLRTGQLSGIPRLADLCDLVANLLGSQLALFLLAVLLLLAPDGQLLSRRWRGVLVVLAASYALLIVGLALVYLRGLTPSSEIILAVGQLGVLAGLLLSVAALLIRLRRSTGDTRQQLRWITAAAAVLASAPAAAAALSLTGAQVTPLWVLALLHLGYLGVPVATGVAVLRYRLYDVNRLVGGSVVLAVLAVLALAGYVAAVALLGTALPAGGATGDWLPLVVFVAVLLVLQPIRHATRRFADRLVYGPQAMSYETLTRFTRELTAETAGRAFLPGVAAAAARLVTAPRCTAVLILDDGSERAETWSGSQLPHRSVNVTPVHHQGVEVGRLEVELPDLAEGTQKRRELLTVFADRVAEGFVQARFEQSLRRQAEELQQLNRALEDSRRRLWAARDVGRRQVAAQIDAEVVDRLRPVAHSLHELAGQPEADAPAEPEARRHTTDWAAEVDAAVVQTTSAIDQLRRITSTVFSRRLAEHGLAAALSSSVLQPETQLSVSGSAQWPSLIQSCLYACCTDLLRQVPGTVRIDLQTVDETAEVTVTTSAAPPPGWLESVREQIEVLAGTVEERSGPGGHAVIHLPLIAVGAYS